MATTTTYIGYDDQPVPGPDVYFALRKPGQSEIESFHPTEAAAIKAASDRSLASSPPGTTAVIGADSIAVTIAGKTFTVTIERDGDLIEVVNQFGRRLAAILRITPRVVYTPGPLDPWQVRERPFAALREAALDYARHTLPAAMVAVLEAVDAGRLAWEAAPRALGIRGRMESCPDGEDDPTFNDQTPKAIREDAWRGWHLLNAWLPAPNYYPVRAARTVDGAYRRRLSFLVQACDRALRDLPPPTDAEIAAGAITEADKLAAAAG